MLKNFEGARLGIFIFLGTVLLVISILLLGNKESLFVSTINVKSYFNSIEGLKTGAPVRLSGYDIGSVSGISLAPDTSGRVEVNMRIDNTVRHFIRLNSVASIKSEGLVGKQIISIAPGTTTFEIVQDGGVIPSKDPVNVDEIIAETQSIMAYVKDITRDFSDIVNKINSGNGSIGKLVNDDQLYNSTVAITKSADKSLNEITNKFRDVSDFLINITTGFDRIVANVDTSVADIKNLVARVNNGDGVLGGLINDNTSYDSIRAVINNLVLTTESTRNAASKFEENMEALKHNWLFKSYFEQRGYWDKLQYEKDLDSKIFMLQKQNKILDDKIREMLELQDKLGLNPVPEDDIKDEEPGTK